MRVAAVLALAAAGAASRAAAAGVRAGASALSAHAAESLACGKTGASCTTDADCCSGNLSTNIYTACTGSGAYWSCSPRTSLCQINFCQTTG